MLGRLTKLSLLIASSLLIAPWASAAPNRVTLASEIDTLHARIQEGPYHLDFNPGRELYLFVRSAPPSSYSEEDIKLLARELFYYRDNLPYHDTSSIRYYAAESLGYIGPRATIIRDELKHALMNEGCANRQPALITTGVIPDAMRQIGVQPQRIDCNNFDGGLGPLAAR